MRRWVEDASNVIIENTAASRKLQATRQIQNANRICLPRLVGVACGGIKKGHSGITRNAQCSSSVLFVRVSQ